MGQSVIVPGISRRTFWIAYGCIIAAMIIYMAFTIKKSVYSYAHPAVNIAVSKEKIIDFPAIEVCSTDPTYALDCNNLTGSCLCYPFPNIYGYPLKPSFSADYDLYTPYYEEAAADYGTRRRRRGGPRPKDDDGFSPIEDVQEIHDVIVEYMNARKPHNTLHDLIYMQEDDDDESELSDVHRKVSVGEYKREQRLDTAAHNLKRILTAAPSGLCASWLISSYEDYAPGSVPIIQLANNNDVNNPIELNFLSNDINFAKWNSTVEPSLNISDGDGGYEIESSGEGQCRFQFNVSNAICKGQNPTNTTYIRFKFTNIPDFKQSATGGANVSVGDYGAVEQGADTYFYFIDGLASIDGKLDFTNVFDYYPSPTHQQIADTYANFTAAYPNSYFQNGLVFTSSTSALTLLQTSIMFGGFSAEVYWTCSPPPPQCQPGCDTSDIGDGICNLECLSPACNQDTPLFSNKPSDCAEALAAKAANGQGSCMDQKYNIYPSYTNPASKCTKFNLPAEPVRLNSKQKHTNIVIANASSIKEAQKQSNIRSKAGYVTIVLGGYTLKNSKPYAFQGYTLKIYHPMEQKRTGDKGRPNKGLKYALPANFQTVVSITQEVYVDVNGHKTFSYDGSTSSAPMFVPESHPPKPSKGTTIKREPVSPYAVPCSIPDNDPNFRCTTTIIKLQMSSFIVTTTTEYVAMDANAVIGALGGFWSLLAGLIAFLFPVIGGVEQKRFIFDKTNPLPDELYDDVADKKTLKEKFMYYATFQFLKGWDDKELTFLQKAGLQKNDVKDRSKIKSVRASVAEMVDISDKS
eukprot:c15224_g1_i1.p1 GENE.c15224_g1_i1~~c15224_g1_i1.p1  ORF type:complete len:817 (+),score=36.94 c15224_g1_i1:43-2451(+)